MISDPVRSKVVTLVSFSQDITKFCPYLFNVRPALSIFGRPYIDKLNLIFDRDHFFSLTGFVIYDDDVLLQFLVLMGELFGGGGDSTLDFLVVSSSGINSLEINDNLVNFLDFRKETFGCVLWCFGTQ